MKYLNRKELEEARAYIAGVCQIPANNILIDQYGRFEIHQVKEQEKQRIESALRMDENISDLSIFSSGYDFNRMTYPGLPSQKYTITGLVHIISDEIDDDMSGMNY